MAKGRKKTFKTSGLNSEAADDSAVGIKPRPDKLRKEISPSRKKQLVRDISTERKAAINLDEIFKPQDKKIEQKKKLITWLGVGSLMIIFFIVWIVNLEHEFSASIKKNDGQEINFDQTKAEFSQAIDQVKRGLTQLKQLQNNREKDSAGKPELSPEQIDLLKTKLLDEAASGTASSTNNYNQ